MPSSVDVTVRLSVEDVALSGRMFPGLSTEDALVAALRELAIGPDVHAALADLQKTTQAIATAVADAGNAVAGRIDAVGEELKELLVDHLEATVTELDTLMSGG